MDNWKVLARHYRRVVNDFIESVLDGMDLDGVERNVAGVALRREVETVLVPGLSAVLARLLEADADALARLPEWLDRVSSVMPAESGFLTEMGRRVDPAGASLVEEGLGLLPGESLARREFRNCLWELVPCVSRAAGSWRERGPAICRASWYRGEFSRPWPVWPQPSSSSGTPAPYRRGPCT